MAPAFQPTTQQHCGGYRTVRPSCLLQGQIHQGNIQKRAREHQRCVIWYHQVQYCSPDQSVRQELSGQDSAGHILWARHLSRKHSLFRWHPSHRPQSFQYRVVLPLITAISNALPVARRKHFQLCIRLCLRGQLPVLPRLSAWQTILQMHRRCILEKSIPILYAYIRQHLCFFSTCLPLSRVVFPEALLFVCHFRFYSLSYSYF